MSTLTGYPREDGRWGVRNHVLVMPVRAAANVVAARISSGVPGTVAVAHEWDGMPSGDEHRLRRAFTGFVTNPNVFEAVVIGVTPGDAWLADAAAARGGRAKFVSFAECRGITETIERGTQLASAATRRARSVERALMSPAHLMLGLECGGSDGMSGITANPALGVATEMLVAAGGTAVLAETPELIGAEEILARRAVSPEVARQVLDAVLGFEQAIVEMGVDVRGAQPAPGNIAGGITTIEEKSLGAAKKGGNAPVTGVVDYAERPTAAGLNIMDTPGHDIEQMVGMVAGGCQIVAFTTGRGTPTGSPVAPCLKIATNTEMFTRMAGDIDIDAGVVLSGHESVRSMGARLYEALLRTAAGELTASERHGNHEFAVSRTAYSAAA